MPKSWRRYLLTRDLRTHLFRALGLGLLLRGLSAWFVYGPQALDDYKHGVWPAYQMFKGQTVEIPEYRSWLLNGVLRVALEVAGLLGVTSARGQVRAMYFELGLISLLGIYGTYLFARHQRSRLWGRAALYLSAVYPLAPFVGTRAFGEAVANALVPLGFGLMPAAPFWAFLALGAGTLFRFQVGVIFVFAGGWALVTRRLRVVAWAAFAGLITLAAEAGIDVCSGRAPLATLQTYITENEGGAVRYGVSPWYNPWLFVLLVALVPFSLGFAGRLPALARRHGLVFWAWVIFVAVHSLVPHKEERFLYPILTLELWSLAYLWTAHARSWGARRVFTPVLAGVTVMGLLVTSFVNSQAGEIEPPAEIESQFHNVVYLESDSLFGQSRFLFYFLRPPSELRAVRPTDFTATRIDDELTARPDRQAVALLTSNADARETLRTLTNVRTTRALCGEVRRAQSLVDQLLYHLNPRHNQRRRPTWYLVCARSPRADL